MLETLENLYRALQLEKRPWIRNKLARWYVLPGGSREWEGPYEAAEIAYLIYSGRIDRGDTVVNGDSWSQYRVGGHRFLSSWMKHDPDKEARLLKALLQAHRRASALRSSGARPPVGIRLTPEQERAFRILNLPPTSSPEERKRRHRDLAKQHHPDRGGSLARMKEINWAYDVVQRAAAPRSASGKL